MLISNPFEAFGGHISTHVFLTAGVHHTHTPPSLDAHLVLQPPEQLLYLAVVKTIR